MMTKQIFIVTFGNTGRAVYYTEYHAEQFCRALHLNRTPYVLTIREARR